MTPERAKRLVGKQSDGRLSPCPDLPNCICSQYADDQSHFIEPIAIQGESATQAWKRLAEVLASFPEACLVEEDSDYRRYEFRSRLFGFIDDVEFLLDEKAGLIHGRSASRLGTWDFGANRKRWRRICQKLAAHGR